MLNLPQATDSTWSAPRSVRCITTRTQWDTDLTTGQNGKDGFAPSPPPVGTGEGLLGKVELRQPPQCRIGWVATPRAAPVGPHEVREGDRTTQQRRSPEQPDRRQQRRVPGTECR